MIETVSKIFVILALLTLLLPVSAFYINYYWYGVFERKTKIIDEALKQERDETYSAFERERAISLGRLRANLNIRLPLGKLNK